MKKKSGNKRQKKPKKRNRFRTKNYLGPLLLRSLKQKPTFAQSRVSLINKRNYLNFSAFIKENKNSDPKSEIQETQESQKDHLSLVPQIQDSSLIPSPPTHQISHQEVIISPSSAVLPSSAGSTILLTQQLIKPNEQLKNSIEAFLLDQRSPHTQLAYRKDLKRFIKFLLLKDFQKGVSSINRTLLISYKESMLSEDLEHTTIDRHLATLRSFFKWLVDDGVIDKSPAEGVRFLNPKRISRTIGFSDEEVQKVLSAPNLHTRTGAMHYAILMVLFYCGLRRSELCELRTTNLGTERNQNVLRLRGKGNAERIIVIIPPVWNAIHYYFHITRRSIAVDQYLFLPVRNNRTQILSKALDPSMIFYIVKKYAKKSGISNRVSPHSCRATAISNARDHHVPDRAIQEFAGWTSPDMITRYDKRRTSIEDSAAHAISYGAEARELPEPLPLANSQSPSKSSVTSPIIEENNSS